MSTINSTSETTPKRGLASRWRNNATLPHVFVILFGVIIAAAVLTYILPAGVFERAEINGRDTVVRGTYEVVASTPAGPSEVLTAIYRGLLGAANIIFYIFIVGAAFGVLRATGAVDSAVGAMSRKLRGKEILFIPVIMIFFSLGGAMLGLAEETIPYITLLVPIAIALGYDSIVGTACVLLGAGSGFAAAFLNPFNVGVAQGVADLPLFSGMWLRIILWVVLLSVSIAYVMRYAHRIRKEPSRSVLYKQDVFAEEIRSRGEQAVPDFTLRHKLVFLVLVVSLVVLAIGVTNFGWYLPEISALFLLMGILVGIVGRLRMNETAEAFLDGAGQMVMGALVVGVAYGILVIFKDGQILDTILYSLAGAVGQLPGALAATAMFFVQGLISFIVPSGSGQAALTMPLMAPLSDMVGVTRQTAVLAYQLADGIGNLFFPTSGYFMAAIAVARIPWTKWVRWIWPLLLIQAAIALAFIIFAQMVNYS